MSKQKANRHVVGASIAGIISVLLLVAAGWLFLNRQYVADLANVWGYEPTQAIRTIDDRVDFTEKGKFYFYTTHPVVATADKFNEDCPRQEPNSPILGCYSSGRIFIYDITNAQLDGIEEVTAAHEMLHAVWERMSDTERTRITALLQKALAENADPQLMERIDYYERSEPGQVVNELHSILPTEIKVLSPELEEYYKQYFTDRQKIVSLHEKYSAVFDGLVAQSNSLYDALSQLSTSIDLQTTEYDAAVTALSADINGFNSRAANGGFSSQAAFNQERSALIARSNQLEALRLSLGEQIALYNIKYEEYQKLAVQIEALNKSIDSITELRETPTIE